MLDNFKLKTMRLRIALWVLVGLTTAFALIAPEKRLEAERFPTEDARETEIDTISIIMDSVIEHLKYHESYQEKAYIGNNGKYVIGYGHEMEPGFQVYSLSEKDAEKLLRLDVEKSIECARSQYRLKGVKAIAIGLFIFNCGQGNYERSTLKKVVSKGKDIQKEISRWCHFTQGGVVYESKRLLERRLFELKIYENKLI